MRGWKKYQENEVKISNPLKITVMAYERCILNLKFVKEKQGTISFMDAEKRLLNTEQIVNELSMQLNRDQHGNQELLDLVSQLDRLYSWLLAELEMIRLKREFEKIDSVIEVMQNLLDGYRGALNKNDK